jgi:preprotein translocase subunit SecA
MIKKIYGHDYVIEEEDLYGSNDPREGLLDLLWEEVENLYEKREEKIGTDRMRAIEKELFLYELDDQWKAHLTAIDHLREGINLQGYRQIDPKLVYKKEAYNMFQELLERIKANLLEKLFHIEIIEEDFDETQFMTRRTRKKPMRMHRGNVEGEEEAPEEDAGPVTVKRDKPKLGRNSPCWCGSGKKYKKCHLAEDLKNNA